jgi:hypothetical protein
VIVHQLYTGSKFTGVSLEPDAKWPDMWRIRMGERLSDLVNLTRAKDAAITWARPRGLGGGGIATWHRRVTERERSPAAQNAPALGGVLAAPETRSAADPLPDWENLR